MNMPGPSPTRIKVGNGKLVKKKKSSSSSPGLFIGGVMLFVLYLIFHEVNLPILLTCLAVVALVDGPRGVKAVKEPKEKTTTRFTR